MEVSLEDHCEESDSIIACSLLPVDLGCRRLRVWTLVIEGRSSRVERMKDPWIGDVSEAELNSDHVNGMSRAYH